MRNKNSLWLNLTGVICYFLGIACVASLILIPLGIYCFIVGRKYFDWSLISDTELYNHKASLKTCGIFVAIVAFPIGLVALIPLVQTGNNPVVSNVNETKEDKERRAEAQEKAEEMGITVEKQEEPRASHENVTSKEETLEKLKKFKDDGLITEDEYKKAVKELNSER